MDREIQDQITAMQIVVAALVMNQDDFKKFKEKLNDILKLDSFADLPREDQESLKQQIRTMFGQSLVP